MLGLLSELRIYSLSRSDIDNFAYEHRVEVKGKELRITTDEGDVQGFLKVLIDEGARIEVFSSHDWTDEGLPRREESENDTAGSDGG
jgi:hypothetical protein